MRTITGLIALCGLAACSKSSTPPAQNPEQKRYATDSIEPDFTPPADCAAALEAVRARLEKLDPLIPEQLDVFAPLVARAETPTKKGVVVSLVRGAVRLDRFPLDRAQLKQRLLGRVRYGVPLYIYAGGREAASDVLAIAADAPTGAEAFLVVMRRDAPFPWERVRPAPSAGWASRQHEQLAKAADDESRARLASAAMVTSLGTCEAAKKVFAPHADKPTTREARRLADPILAAVEGCNCEGVEMAGLELAVPVLMSRWNKLGALSLARTRVMRLAPRTTVTDLAMRLTPPAPKP